MASDPTEVHTGTDAARAGSTPNTVRWILAIGLFAAIVLLSVIWMVGAATQDDSEEHVNVSRQVQEQEQAAGDSTDSIVGEDADRIQDAPQADDTPSADATVAN